MDLAVVGFVQTTESWLVVIVLEGIGIAGNGKGLVLLPRPDSERTEIAILVPSDDHRSSFLFGCFFPERFGVEGGVVRGKFRGKYTDDGLVLGFAEKRPEFSEDQDKYLEIELSDGPSFLCTHSVKSLAKSASNVSGLMPKRSLQVSTSAMS